MQHWFTFFFAIKAIVTMMLQPHHANLLLKSATRRNFLKAICRYSWNLRCVVWMAKFSEGEVVSVKYIPKLKWRGGAQTAGLVFTTADSHSDHQYFDKSQEKSMSDFSLINRLMNFMLQNDILVFILQSLCIVMSVTQKWILKRIVQNSHHFQTSKRIWVLSGLFKFLSFVCNQFLCYKENNTETAIA